MWPFLPLGHVAEKAAHPVGVTALRAIGVVPSSDTRAQLFERRQRIRLAVLVHDSVERTTLPIRPLQEFTK